MNNEESRHIWIEYRKEGDKNEKEKNDCNIRRRTKAEKYSLKDPGESDLPFTSERGGDYYGA